MARRYGFYFRVMKTVFYECERMSSMQKAVNDVIDIFTNEDMEKKTLVIF